METIAQTATNWVMPRAVRLPIWKRTRVILLVGGNRLPPLINRLALPNPRCGLSEELRASKRLAVLAPRREVFRRITRVNLSTEQPLVPVGANPEHQASTILEAPSMIDNLEERHLVELRTSPHTSGDDGERHGNDRDTSWVHFCRFFLSAGNAFHHSSTDIPYFARTMSYTFHGFDFGSPVHSSTLMPASSHGAGPSSRGS